MTTVSPFADSYRHAPGALRAVSQAAPAVSAEPAKPASEERGFSFRDFLSAINPLQHIPIVGTIYRAITGDTVSPAVRVVGGALLGGPIGLIASVANAIVEQATGKDIGDQALALFMPARTAPVEPPVQFAAADQAASGEAAAKDEEPAATEATASPTTSAIPAGLAQPAVVSSGIGLPGGQAIRTLADYRVSAGRRLPVFDSTRSAASGGRNAPIPLQTTVPSAVDRVRTPVLTSVKATDGQPDDPAGKSAPDPATPEQSGDGITAAMLRGLDRYREMKRQQALQQSPPAQRIDAVL